MRRTHRRLPQSLPFFRWNTLALVGLLLLAFSGPARAASDDQGKGLTKGPRGGEKAAAPEYGSPRDTLRTLYFAIDVYGQLPQRIDDAVACLGRSPSRARSSRWRPGWRSSSRPSSPWQPCPSATCPESRTGTRSSSTTTRS